MRTLIINEKEYKVGVAELTRSFAPLEKYRVTTADGRTRRGFSGMYVNYSLTLGNIDANVYDQLIDQLTQSQETQMVALPDSKTGDITFNAIFEGIADELLTERDGVRHWDNLTITFSSQQPIKGVRK